jgi:hypothetical protein
MACSLDLRIGVRRYRWDNLDAPLPRQMRYVAVYGQHHPIPAIRAHFFAARVLPPIYASGAPPGAQLATRNGLDWGQCNHAAIARLREDCSRRRTFPAHCLPIPLQHALQDDEVGNRLRKTADPGGIEKTDPALAVPPDPLLMCAKRSGHAG